MLRESGINPGNKPEDQQTAFTMPVTQHKQLLYNFAIIAMGITKPDVPSCTSQILSSKGMPMKILETLLTGLIRLPFIGRLVRRCVQGVHRASANAMKRVARDEVRPRDWSNAELRKFAPLFDGAVINVSGWRDEDKTGGHYQSYFTAAASYGISNYRGESGITGAEGEVFIDLEADLPEELARRYQVAFNHTTLEHVFDIRKAIANICALSNDTVILVTPFLQQVHYIEGSFGDWWRPTPMCIERLLEEQGFHTIYQSSNDNPWYIVYIVTIACRNPESHKGRFPFSKTAAYTGAVHFGFSGAPLAE
jgi:hypothetical protein